MSIEKGKVGVILLGAQSFPNSVNYGSSEAFSNSYKKIKAFLTDDSKGLGLNPQTDILDLFDSDSSADAQDVSISAFIRDRKQKKIEDLIIYYTGHGGYAPENGGYLLTIKSTRDDNPGVSSLTFKTLSITISKYATDLRIYFILDCCFAGEAIYQSTSLEIIKKQVENDFPSKGIAFLCAASKELPAIIVKERNITQFTEGLEKALREGSKIINNGYLTLREIEKITFENIKELNKTNPSEIIRPEVHSPDQREGDIAGIRHFPNYAFLRKIYDFKEQRKEIMVRLGNDNLWEASQLLQTFTFNFSEDPGLQSRAVSISRKSKIIEEKLRQVMVDFNEKNIDRDTREKEQDKLRADGNELLEKIIELVNDAIKSNSGNV